MRNTQVGPSYIFVGKQHSFYQTTSSADSEDEDTGPRLKPVFVSKKERVTIAEKEKELQKQKQLEHEAKRQAEERRRQTLKARRL